MNQQLDNFKGINVELQNKFDTLETCLRKLESNITGRYAQQKDVHIRFTDLEAQVDTQKIEIQQMRDAHHQLHDGVSQRYVTKKELEARVLDLEAQLASAQIGSQVDGRFPPQ